MTALTPESEESLASQLKRTQDGTSQPNSVVNGLNQDVSHMSVRDNCQGKCRPMKDCCLLDVVNNSFVFRTG